MKEEAKDNSNNGDYKDEDGYPYNQFNYATNCPACLTN
jgi:hypothetical protein